MYYTSKDGRFKLRHNQYGSDHWMPDTDIDWDLIDTRTGKQVKSFTGDHMDADSIHWVKFSPDGKEVIAQDEKGEIVERVNLIKLARQLDQNK